MSRAISFTGFIVGCSALTLGLFSFSTVVLRFSAYMLSSRLTSSSFFIALKFSGLTSSTTVLSERESLK